MNIPRIHYDPDPICPIHGEELTACDFGDKYGEGLYCYECMYWWPGANYYPDTDEIESREGERGKRIPWQIMRDMLLHDLEEDKQNFYYEGYADAKAGKPNRYEETDHE